MVWDLTHLTHRATSNQRVRARSRAESGPSDGKHQTSLWLFQVRNLLANLPFSGLQSLVFTVSPCSCKTCLEFPYFAHKKGHIKRPHFFPTHPDFPFSSTKCLYLFKVSCSFKIPCQNLLPPKKSTKYVRFRPSSAQKKRDIIKIPAPNLTFFGVGSNKK